MRYRPIGLLVLGACEVHMQFTIDGNNTLMSKACFIRHWLPIDEPSHFVACLQKNIDWFVLEMVKEH